MIADVLEALLDVAVSSKNGWFVLIVIMIILGVGGYFLYWEWLA